MIKIKRLKDIKKYELQSLYDSSSSLIQIFRKLGYGSKGGNYKTLKKYAKLLCIDTCKFEQNKLSEVRKTTITIPNDLVFVENCSYNVGNKSLKKRLVRDFNVDYSCSKCGISEWNGKTLSLQLDHINGINDDNRLENLRFLCPNCHSQTNTYAGRNNIKSDKSICPECGGYKSRQSKMCRKCNYKYRIKNNIIPVTKNDLFELLKTNSFVKVGDLYGVSDNAVRKWCKKYNIPDKSSYYKTII